MLSRGGKVRIETDRLTLRPPRHADFRAWSSAAQREPSFLTPWEPTWAVITSAARPSPTASTGRSARSPGLGGAAVHDPPQRDEDVLLGAITLDNIRRGPAQAGTLGYWIGERHARQGYMRETIEAVVHYAFRTST
jgi:ribosomal-protein-alanine N-acetyltransferase